MAVDPDNPHMLALARAIDDDLPIDWRAEEATVQGDADRAILSELRLLNDLTRLARDPEGQITTAHLGNAVATGPAARTGRWGSLTIFEEIGRGAFSRVYRARDSLGRDVALKLFKDSGNSSRLLREGQLLARVRHPNVVVVYGAAEVGGEVGLWMELIQGRTLEDELKARGALSAEEARLIGLDLCRALAAVHEAGLVHRDVKAQNVMREQGGRTVLMDFGAGIARDTDVHLDVAGTPMYLAPEVYAGQQASPVSDIYSLGVLLYHLVTGTFPLTGSNRLAIERAHVEGRIRRLRDSRPDLPADFAHVVETALASDPRDRYQTAGDLEHALRSHQKDPAPPHPRPAPSPLRIASMAALVVLVAGALMFTKTRWLPVPAPGSAPMASQAPNPLPSADTGYTVEGAFYKYSDGQRVRLGPGDRVAPGDGLGFQIKASIPVFVYVVNEDDHGEAYLLFPLPGQESLNPLSGGVAHELPGIRDARDVHWQVTSVGGREHFVIYASPERMGVIDEQLRSLPAPVAGRTVTATRLPESALTRLRGLGGLTAPAGPSKAHYLFEGAGPLGANADTAHGLWVRQLTLENPGH
jgi:hypothetical protein